MLCPKCQTEQNDLNLECRKCGIIFAKYKKRQKQLKNPIQCKASIQDVENGEDSQLRRLLFTIPADNNYVSLTGRILIYIIMLIWGVKFMFAPIESNYAGRSFMHLINLPFHEAGHVLFRPFGSFLTSLGGSLGQMLMPLICFIVLLVKTKDAFGASVSLWWFGQNFFDMAPYINDARSGTLPLVGWNFGHSSPYGFHDWEFLLTESGLLRFDHVIAKLSVAVGSGVMLLSFVWGIFLLFAQYKECK